MIKKIDVLLPRISQYEVMHHFAKKISEAFARAGFKTRLLNREQYEETYKKSPPDLTVGFNGAPRDEEGKMLCDIYEVPHLSFLLDPPYRFPYLVDSPLVQIGCDDRTCCKLLNDVGCQNTFFFPNSVETELNPDNGHEKIYDIVLPATFIDFEELWNSWPSKFDADIVKALRGAADETFTDKDKSFITSFREHCGARFDWKELSDPLQELELYVKGKDRALLLEALPDRTIHIFGNTVGKRGWKEYLGKKHPSIYVHNSIPYIEALEIMKKTKILINPCLKNKDGTHDRLFSGIACGAVVVTTDSHYLRETFSEGDGACYYSFPEIEPLKDKITSYLDNETLRSDAVAKGYEIIKNHHTWDHRVKELLETVFNKI